MLFDFSKVQKDYLTAVLKAEKSGSFSGWFIGHKEEDKITYFSDGHFVACIPDQMCYVKAAGRVRVLDNPGFLDNNLIAEAEQVELFDRGMRKKIDSRKVNVCILENDDFCVWVNEKLLNYFTGMRVHFMGKSPVNPVMVYMGEQLVGIIMPIKQP